MSKPNSLVFLLVMVLTGAMLGPALLLGGIGYDFAYERVRAEKIRSVGWVSETRREQLVTALRRATARAQRLLDDLDRRCAIEIDVGHCVRQPVLDFVASERALWAEWRAGPAGEPLAMGAPFFQAADWTPFRPGQLVRFSARRAAGERFYQTHVQAPSGSRLMVMYPVALLQEIFVNHPDLGRSGETFLADEEGYFLTQPRYESIEGSSHPISARPMQECLSTVSSEVLDLDYRQVDIIHGFRFVPEIGGCIMAHIDQQEAFAELTVLRRSFLSATLIFVVLAALIAVAVARRIARPILGLTAATRAIMGGDYGTRAAEGGPAEIAELAGSFNKMLERLKFTLMELHDHERDLEARIRERTAELEEANRQLETLSLSDALTGLGNRRQLDQALAAEWRRAIRQGQALAFVLIDVDHFKAYNDRYGHPAGDVCLRQVGQTLARFAQRAGELAARYGGEEFAILLPATGAAEARHLAEAIRRAICDLAIAHEAAPSGLVTVSQGVAVLIPSEGQDAADLVRLADQALYQAKALGRNRVVASAPVGASLAAIAGKEGAGGVADQLGQAGILGTVNLARPAPDLGQHLFAGAEDHRDG
jgi:diguanylate cyclase (GGDEF)-like protein